MDEMQFGPWSAFVAIFLIFMGVISVFFSGSPPIPMPNSSPSGPPSEIKLYTTGGALVTEMWMETRSINVTTRLFFRVYHSGEYPQRVWMRLLGGVPNYCSMGYNPSKEGWVMEPNTYQTVEIAATPRSIEGVGDFQISVETDYLKGGG